MPSGGNKGLEWQCAAANPQATFHEDRAWRQKVMFFFIRKPLASAAINAVFVIKEIFRRQPCVAVSLDIEG
jgi:hypothetical protein